MPNTPHDNPSIGTHELYRGNVEAHLIADMLRIESLSTEVATTKEMLIDRIDRLAKAHEKRLDKMEKWIIAMVASSFMSLLGVVTMLFKVVFAGATA